MGASEDLLAKLTVLHNFVERELQGVVTAVSDLGVDERPARKLRSILTQAHDRIQTALGRQRMLLWKFSVESNPAAGHTYSAEDERRQRRKGPTKNGPERPSRWSMNPAQDRGMHPTSTWPPMSNKIDGDEGAKEKEELEWKRDTLVRMKSLLQRKARDHTATQADRAASTRDILKITQALERLQSQTNDYQRKTSTCATASTNSAETPEEGYSFKANAGTMGVEPSSASARSTRGGDESARDGTTTSQSKSVAREQQEEGGVAMENAWSVKSARNVELRLPDGLDLLLGRIAEGVRRPPTKPAESRLPSSELPSAFTSTHPGQHNNGGGENGKGSNNKTHTTTSLPRVDPPCTYRGRNEEGGRGASPVLSKLVDGMNDHTRKGHVYTQGASRNVPANRILRDASMVPAANFGSAKTSGPTCPLVTEEFLRKELTGSSEKENQPRIS